jgi:HTH-type transcriptional regulator / antitoxin HipB
MVAVSGSRQLGAVVRAARRDRGLSQSALAAASGVSRAWLARFEGGHPAASLEPVFRVLDTLGLGLAVTERRVTAAEADVLDALAAEERP